MLEYGSCPRLLQAALFGVRQILTDMGTELAIANVGSAEKRMLETVNKQWMKSRFVKRIIERRSLSQSTSWWRQSSRQFQDVRQLAPTSAMYLFPLALQVLGSQHILDLTIRDSLAVMSWWPSWEASAKGICQF